MSGTRLRAVIPWAMVLLRVALAPLVVVLAWAHVDARWLGLIVLTALVDDIYDGVLARRWGCDTPAIRLADSLADTVFYLGAAGALWIREPEVIRRNAAGLAVLFGIEGVRYVFDLCKFRRAASYHSYLAKVWGLVLATALVAVLSFRGMQGLVRAAIALGVLVNVEGLAMSVMLRSWHNDVRTLGRAWKLRQQEADGVVADRVPQRRGPR